jgi:transposase
MIRTGGNGGDDGVRVWVATAPVDMRKSFDGLAEVVRAFLGRDPLSGSLFVFRNRSGQRVKVLWWDRNGLAIFNTRLETGAFAFPAPPLPGEKSVAVSAADLATLLAGCTLQPSR